MKNTPLPATPTEICAFSVLHPAITGHDFPLPVFVISRSSSSSSSSSSGCGGGPPKWYSGVTPKPIPILRSLTCRAQNHFGLLVQFDAHPFLKLKS